MNARLYIRVSREEQVKHGLSLDAQLKELQDYCEKYNYNIVKIYKDEGISGGSIKKRLAFQQMISDTVSGDIILFTKLDRFSRNLLDALSTIKKLQEKNVSVKATQQEIDTTTTQGRTMMQILFVIAQSEREMTSDRIRSVFNYKIKQGYTASHIVPLGYKLENKKYVKDDEAAEAIYELFKYYDTYSNMTKTTRWWNETYPQWKNENKNLKVYRLQNEIYIGKHPSGLNDHFCEPIVDEALFYRVQSKLNKNIKEHTTTKNVYLFSKLLICPECGRVLVGNYQNQRNYYVYRCNNYAINGLCKFNHTCSENKIEKLLLDEIKTKVNNEISIKLIKNPKNDKMKKQKRIEAVKNQIDRLQDLYIDGTIDKEKFNSKYTSLNNELNELEHSIEPAVESVTKELMNTNIEELYDKLDREHKQAFWHKFIDKIYYYPKQKRIEVVYK